MDNKIIHIIGGGTVSYVRNHLALCAPAYGSTARLIAEILGNSNSKMDIKLHLTKMAGGNDLETNEDISKLVEDIVADTRSKIVFFSAAMCDWEGRIVNWASLGTKSESGKYAERLHSRSDKVYDIELEAASKVVHAVRKSRKDMFLVAFKTTCGLTADEQYVAGLHLLKEASANLVLANDVKTRLNMVITPEEAKYHVTTSRQSAIAGLVDMALKRSHLTFTRSTVVAGTSIPWDSKEVPSALRAVVDYCINKNAYKPFRGSTVGHFATKLSDNEFLTSIRKTDFNDLSKVGLVRIKTDGPDSVMAFGAKPSVGGQSQRIVFHDHQDYDCIVHFHCPLKDEPRDNVPVASQREYECGSHQCGKNTSDHLRRFGNLSAVMLDQHGPNIVFNSSIDPQEVIDFIEANFELSRKTGGYVAVPPKFVLEKTKPLNEVTARDVPRGCTADDVAFDPEEQARAEGRLGRRSLIQWTTSKKPRSEITASDIPPGLTADDVAVD